MPQWIDAILVPASGTRPQCLCWDLMYLKEASSPSVKCYIWCVQAQALFVHQWVVVVGGDRCGEGVAEEREDYFHRRRRLMDSMGKATTLHSLERLARPKILY